MNLMINIGVFIILTVLWLGFGAALLTNPEILQDVWQIFRGWHWLVQGLITLLMLPLVLGLWVWQTSWHLWLRLILVIGLAWITLYSFFPRKADHKPEAASLNSRFSLK